MKSYLAGFSAWVKTDPETFLRRHVVDAKGFYPAFREAPARRHEPSSQEYRFHDDVPKRLTEQRRLSVYNWNPGPRRGKEGSIELRCGETRCYVTKILTNR